MNQFDFWEKQVLEETQKKNKRKRPDKGLLGDVWVDVDENNKIIEMYYYDGKRRITFKEAQDRLFYIEKEAKKNGRI